MKAGGWGGYRSRSRSVDRLVVRLVGLLVLPIDVWRQWYMTVAGEQLGHGRIRRWRLFYLNQSKAVITPFADRQPGIFADKNAIAVSNPFARAQHRFPGRVRLRVRKEDLDAPAGPLKSPVDPGLHDACVVDDEKIGFGKVTGKMPEGRIRQSSVSPVDTQESGPVPRTDRFGGDAIGRQVIIEVGKCKTRRFRPLHNLFVRSLAHAGNDSRLSGPSRRTGDRQASGFRQDGLAWGTEMDCKRPSVPDPMKAGTIADLDKARSILTTLHSDFIMNTD